MRPADLLVRADRTSGVYKAAVSLAHLILNSLGISLRLGAQSGTAFLIRTPELIEQGLRNVVSRVLPGVSVDKRSKPISKTGLTMNPDLVFNGGCAVGDIKYRTLGPDWQRNDLYQAVAFAAAFKAKYSVLLGFSQHAASNIPQRVQVGDVHVQPVAWCADANVAPAESERMLHVELQRWWSAMSCRAPLVLNASLLA
jgi:5-methylcytosine-specific restriction endonuclease McrBC regulatory subunit McrC